MYGFGRFRLFKMSDEDLQNYISIFKYKKSIYKWKTYAILLFGLETEFFAAKMLQNKRELIFRRRYRGERIPMQRPHSGFLLARQD